MKLRHGRVEEEAKPCKPACLLLCVVLQSYFSKNGHGSCVNMLYDPCQRRCHTHVHRLSIQLTFFVFQKTLGTQINSKFLTVRVISHGPISLKIVLVVVVVVVVVVGDILLKFQYIMNN